MSAIDIALPREPVRVAGMAFHRGRSRVAAVAFGPKLRALLVRHTAVLRPVAGDRETVPSAVLLEVHPLQGERGTSRQVEQSCVGRHKTDAVLELQHRDASVRLLLQEGCCLGSPSSISTSMRSQAMSRWANGRRSL